MKKKLTACMLACFMILPVGCSSNTAKENAKNETKTETSFPAGNCPLPEKIDRKKLIKTEWISGLLPEAHAAF